MAENEEKTQQQIKEETKNFIDSQKQITKVNNVNVTSQQAEEIQKILAGKSYEKEISEKEAENSDLKKKLGYGGGSVSMSKEQIAQESINQAQNNGDLTFEGNSIAEAHEKMINYLQASNDPKDKLALDKLWEKSINALTQSHQSFEFKDRFDENGRSIIGRTIQRENERIRRVRGYKQ